MQLVLITLAGLLAGLIGGWWTKRLAEYKTNLFYISPTIAAIVFGIWACNYYKTLPETLYVISISVILTCIAQLDFIEQIICDDMIYGGLILTAVSHLYANTGVAWITGIATGAAIGLLQFYIGQILFGPDKKPYGIGDITLSCLIGSMFTLHAYLEVFFLSLLLMIAGTLGASIIRRKIYTYVPVAPATAIAIGIQTICPITPWLYIQQFRSFIGY